MRRRIVVGPETQILRLGGRPPRATATLLIVQGALFLLYVFANGPAWIHEHLALSAGQALGLFELWQPLTAMWVHVEPRGLFFNLATLWVFGPPLERWWGRRRFVVFFVTTGVVGLIAAMFVGLLWPQQLVSGSAGSVIALTLAAAVLFPRHLAHLHWLLGIEVRWLGYGLIAFSVLGSLIQAAWLDVAVSLGGLACAWLFLDSIRRRLADWRVRRAKKKFRVVANTEKSNDYLN